MQRQTAADALIDAGREVVTAVGSDRDCSEPKTTEQGEPLVVGTLLVLAAAEAPILVVALVGYVITAARDPDSPISGFDDWIAVGTAGARGTALLVGATLPVAAALAGSGLLDVEAGSVALGSAPGPIVGVGIAALAAATWHAVVVGIVAVAAGGDWDIVRGVRFGQSAAGIRLSAALAGLAGGVGLVGYGLTAIPIVGPVLAASVGAVGVAVAGRLVGWAAVEADRRSESDEWGTGGDRLAAPMDGTEAIRCGSLDGEADQHGTGGKSGPARPTATPRRSRRGRP